jgi:hypothetical protein
MLLRCERLEPPSGGHERPKGHVCVESARLPTADIGQRSPYVAFVPIVLQKSKIAR